MSAPNSPSIQDSPGVGSPGASRSSTYVAKVFSDISFVKRSPKFLARHKFCMAIFLTFNSFENSSLRSGCSNTSDYFTSGGVKFLNNKLYKRKVAIKFHILVYMDCISANASVKTAFKLLSWNQSEYFPLFHRICR